MCVGETFFARTRSHLGSRCGSLLQSLALPREHSNQFQIPSVPMVNCTKLVKALGKVGDNEN